MKWHIETSKDIGQLSPCLVEQPDLPESCSLLLKAFTYLNRTGDYSINNIVSLHKIYPLIGLEQFIDLMLSIKQAYSEA